MKKIVSFFKHIRNPFHKFGSGPKGDWYVALTFALIGIVIAVSIDALLFYTLLGKETVPTKADNLSSIGISKDDISAAIQSIEKKNGNNSLLPLNIKDDPSL